MNREIKFKVWDGVDYMSNPFTLHDIISKNIWFTKDAVILQYIDIKDKNGVEIYEGDIIRTKMFLGGEEEHYENISIGKVVFDCGAFQSSADDLNVDYYNEIEVIGNIFESPDLLTGKEPERS